MYSGRRLFYHHTPYQTTQEARRVSRPNVVIDFSIQPRQSRPVDPSRHYRTPLSRVERPIGHHSGAPAVSVSERSDQHKQGRRRCTNDASLINSTYPWRKLASTPAYQCLTFFGDKSADKDQTDDASRLASSMTLCFAKAFSGNRTRSTAVRVHD